MACELQPPRISAAEKLAIAIALCIDMTTPTRSDYSLYPQCVPARARTVRNRAAAAGFGRALDNPLVVWGAAPRCTLIRPMFWADRSVESAHGRRESPTGNLALWKRSLLRQQTAWRAWSARVGIRRQSCMLCSVSQNALRGVIAPVCSARALSEDDSDGQFGFTYNQARSNSGNSVGSGLESGRVGRYGGARRTLRWVVALRKRWFGCHVRAPVPPRPGDPDTCGSSACLAPHA